MPKKSRREKMLADIRRRVRTEHVLTLPATTSPIREQARTFQFKPSPGVKPQETITPSDTAELTTIKRDLTKTVVLAAIAILGELAIYWFGKGKI